MGQVLEYVKGKKIWLKNHAEFNEAWLRDLIVNDPSILGLGDVVVKDVERMQPSGGRLDLLLHDPDIDKRYEVEIMLGQVNESHIIRCIEYWDIERKRYPNYDHCAVLIAEDITSRFLNVISLFNRAIPMISIQMNAIQIGEKLVLDFVKVFDEVSLGEPEEEEVSEREIVDRAYWDNRGSATTMKIVDDCLPLLKEASKDLEFKYNKYYIGLSQNNRPNNFVVFKPRKKYVRAEIKVNDLEALAERFKDADIEVAKIDKRWGRVWLHLAPGDVETNKDLLTKVFREAYEESLQ